MRYNAVTFLEGLFLPAEVVSPADLPADWYLAWDERAAIIEYDGNQPRERAEHFALFDVVRQMWLASSGPANEIPDTIDRR